MMGSNHSIKRKINQNESFILNKNLSKNNSREILNGSKGKGRK